MGVTRTVIPGDWIRLEQIINELFKQTVPDIDSEVATNTSNIAVLQSEMTAIYGTIESVDALPDPVVEHKVILLTTDSELYIGKMI